MQATDLDLHDLPPWGFTIDCPRCGKEHNVAYARSQNTGKINTDIAYYMCGDRTFMFGLEVSNIEVPDELRSAID